MDDAELHEKLKGIRLLAMDVDGVLTDGTLLLGATASGEPVELKGFHVRDGLALGLVRSAGIEIAWITGRTSLVVERRAAELGITHVIQWARNKQQALSDLACRLGVAREEILYIGDDLNDVPAFAAAGVVVTVADAPAAIRERADWVTTLPGGHGAVREVVEALLHAQGKWDLAVEAFLARLREEQGWPPGTAPSGQ
ncbi:MAG: hydrolase family protein [Armatimonadetes bacterium]|jgi:3-deoxy-D-manno-octulosonate 8-phosphate phosphatase (KDO 8-P phosphatase)|nr:hydrolase family protein [Armatimonadota bacterium]